MCNCLINLAARIDLLGPVHVVFSVGPHTAIQYSSVGHMNVLQAKYLHSAVQLCSLRMNPRALLALLVMQSVCELKMGSYKGCTSRYSWGVMGTSCCLYNV